MNTALASHVRVAALAATLFLLPAFASARDDAGTDRTLQLLALRGSVPVKAAGPYVEVGTYQIQVAAKLGQPTSRLADGTWLYRNYTVVDSDATGTLVVRFQRGRVSALTLVTPAVAMALSAPPKAGDKVVLAEVR
jgi:hypothetical protein